jgi:hypothetical protein
MSGAGSPRRSYSAEEKAVGLNGRAIRLAERRERIATAALQGILAGAVETDGLPAAFDLNLAAWAVKHADALIAELDKPAEGAGV